MSAELPVLPSAELLSRRRSLAGLLATAGAFLAGCSGNSSFAARQPSRLRHFANGVLERSTGKGLAQQYVHITNAGPLRRRRPNDQHELAAQFARGHALGQGEEVAAADFLVQLGELAA